ncbi:hypothetical protein PMI03_00167 [Rhizobium sp. AP16]|nr:hypothetical protein PMI03_00167 [Rhizobium sp. AP16]
MVDFKGRHYPKEVIFYVRYAAFYRDLEAILASAALPLTTRR